MTEVDKGNAMGCLVTGVITGVCGLATTICGFIWLAYGGTGGLGLWCGIPMLIIMVIGILVYAKRSKGAAVAYLVLNIIWCILNGVQAVLAGLLALIFAIWVKALEANGCWYAGGTCHCNQGDNITYKIDNCDILYTLRDSLTAVMAFCAIGAISCFAGSIFGCCIACCSPRPMQPVVVMNQPPQQVVVTTQQAGYVQPGYPQTGYPPPQTVQPPPTY